MSYKFLEGITTADVAFEASGRDLAGMFVSAGQAVAATQIKSLKSIKEKVKRKISLDAENVEELLFKFLDELIFLKDKDLLIFSRFDMDIFEREAKEKKVRDEVKVFRLKATAFGEKLDMKKHEMIVDVKAVTMHQFKVSKEKGFWKARVVLDV